LERFEWKDGENDERLKNEKEKEKDGVCVRFSLIFLK
jgi:hypothetical protein